MKVVLEPIPLLIDKSKAIFASEDCQTLISMWEGFYPIVGYNPPWIGYFVKREGEIVGTCSLIGPPAKDEAEISYWTFQKFEGQGISTASCQELIKIAKKANLAIRIFAKTAPEKNASTTILERNGFKFTKVVQDDEIGDAWRWELIG